MAVRAVDFVEAKWFNTDQALTLKALRGKIIVLDFFTYCCVNCINNLKTIKQLHALYGDRVVVIGIHSAKFDREKEDEALSLAIKRLGISYGVISDGDSSLFKQYAIKAWPTTIVIDDKGYIQDTFQGELTLAQLTQSIENITTLQMPTAQKNHQKLAHILDFPQKILCETNFIAIANTGANSVVLCSYEGQILTCIKNLDSPMGMVLVEATLYICCSGDNTIATFNLETLDQGVFLHNLKTPYDITLYQGDVVVAMAGSHELIAFDKEAQKLWSVGNRFEALRDGFGSAAQLAQPSGIDVVDETLFFVDAETSSLRMCESQEVTTLVGEGLFSFGDSDEGNILLQHPQDVVVGKVGDGCGGGRIFIADTFNSKLKVYNPEDGSMMTLYSELNEPCGLDKKGCDIYIADTNNSKIVRYNLSQMQAFEFPLSE